MFAPTEVVLFVILAVTFTSAAKLPSYITPCSRNDENLSECATKEANKVLPTLLNGDKSLKIPNLRPLKLPEITINTGGNLKIKLMDAVISGFDDFAIKLFQIDLKNKHITLNIKFPRLNLVSQYDINGRILVLPIIGHGPANITFVDGDYIYDADILFEKRGDDEYMKLINSKLDYTTKRNYFQFDNLFEGDKVLGDQMNKFLDENWQDVSKDLGPALTSVITTIATTVINAVLNNIPSDEIFTP